MTVAGKLTPRRRRTSVSMAGSDNVSSTMARAG
jgi:hypothetical protein